MAIVVKLIRLRNADALKDKRPYLVIKFGVEQYKSKVLEKRSRKHKFDQRFAFVLKDKKKFPNVVEPETLEIELWNSKAGKG